MRVLLISFKNAIRKRAFLEKLKIISKIRALKLFINRLELELSSCRSDSSN